MSEALNLAHVELLASVDLFARLDRVALAQIAAYVEPMRVKRGEVVCRQGEATDALYIVALGRFGVFVTAPGERGEIRLATLSAPDYFGEMALLTGKPRSATVRAEVEGELLRLERSRFLDFLRQEPEAALDVAATLSRRLQAADHALTESQQAISENVEQELGRLAPERRIQVLQASVLDKVSLPALTALFGEDAASVAHALADLGVESDQTEDRALVALRAQFDWDSKADLIRLWAGGRLADAERWDDALAVLARCGARSAFVAMLSRALRGVPPLRAELASRWVERLTDEEAAQDAELALARAALHEWKGDRDAALWVVRRGLGKTLVAGDSASNLRLTTVATRLALAGGAPPIRGLDYKLPANEARPRRLGISALLALMLAIVFISGAVVGAANVQWVFTFLLMAAVVLWMSQLVPDYVVGLGLVVAWIFSGIAAPGEAVAAFGSMDWMFVLAIFGIAAAVASSGLLFRVGLLLVQRLPQGLFWQTGAFLLTGLILGPLLPMAMGRATLTAPLALAVAEALRLRDRAPAAAVLGLAAWIGAGPMLFVFLNASPACILLWGLLPETSRQRFDWIHWLGGTWPLAVFVGVGALAMLFLVLRPRSLQAPSRERVIVQLAVLGPPSARELTMIAVLVLTVVGWIAAPALHLGVGTVAVLGLLAAGATGNLDRKALQELDWNYLIFYGVVLGIARLGSSLGLDRVAAEVIGAQLARIGATPLVFVLAIACLTLLMRLILQPEQVVLLLSLALIPVAPAIGMDPWVVIVTILAMALIWFTPSQTPEFLAAYSAAEGRLYSHAQARHVAYGYAVVVLAGLALSVQYWHWIGLL